MSGKTKSLPIPPLTKIHYERNMRNAIIWPNDQPADQFLTLTHKEFDGEGLQKLIQYLPGIFVKGMPDDDDYPGSGK